METKAEKNYCNGRCDQTGETCGGHLEAPEKEIRDCSGCTDNRSEGTHQMHTKQHPCPKGGDPDCGYCFPSKAPEISMVSIDVEPVKKLEFAAPTDESWEIAYGRLLDTLGVKHPRVALETVVFIKELLQKERQNNENELEYLRRMEAVVKANVKAVEAGKSEAFSLVRKIAGEMRKEKVFGVGNNEKYAGYNAALTELLSTLEGK